MDQGLGAYKGYFEAVLQPGESLRWAGRPRFWGFVLPPMGLAVFGLLWGVLGLNFLRSAQRVDPSLSGFTALWAAPFWLVVLWPFYGAFLWLRTAYAITDKRFIVKKGPWRASFISREFKQVRAVSQSRVRASLGTADIDLSPLLAISGDRVSQARQRRKELRQQVSFWAVGDPEAVLLHAKRAIGAEGQP